MTAAPALVDPPRVVGAEAWPARHREALATALALALAAVFLVGATRGLSEWRINDDEEGYLYAAWRISAGELPYRDFLTPQLPAFLYPGAVVVRVMGNEVAPARLMSVAWALVAAVGVWATARRLIGPMTGAVALGVFLFNEDVTAVARAFRPEAALLAAVAWGTYLFVRADTRRSAVLYAAASLAFGLGLLVKLFAVLPWAGLGAYLTVDALRGRRSATGALRDAVLVYGPGLLLVVGVMGAFLSLAPETMNAVLVHHLRQGADKTVLEVVSDSLAFLQTGYLRAIVLVTMLPLGAVGLKRLGSPSAMAVVWQLPTVAAFLLLRRDLFPERHLLVLMPAASVTLAGAVALLASLTRRRESSEPHGAAEDPLRAAWAGPALGASVAAALIVPGLFDAADLARSAEAGTERIAALMRAMVPADGRFLSDNPGLGFYAGRRTTHLGAGISEGATESGQITAEGLLADAGKLSLVTRSTDQGSALADLADADLFDESLARDFDRLGHFFRHYQIHDVFLAKDAPRLGLDYGWAELVAAAPAGAAVESGSDAVVDMVLAVRDRPPEAYTALAHLVGPDGEVWANGDTLLTNGLHRSSEEFEAGEVVAMPMSLAIPDGTPPGTYALNVGMYDAETGARLSWTRAGESGDIAPAAQLEIVRPEAVPSSTGEPMQRAGHFSLLEASVPEQARAGDAVRVETLWRVEEAPGAAIALETRLRSDAGEVAGASSAAPAWPAETWRRGELVRMRSLVSVPADATGALTLESAWGASEPVYATVGRLQVEPLPEPVRDMPASARPVTATVGSAWLAGVAAPDAASPGAPLEITLYWTATEPMTAPLNVLLHVVDEKGALVAQADGPPDGGARPTTGWRRGEVIADTRTIMLPADATGTLSVLAGLYDPADPAFARLGVTQDGVARPDGRVLAASVQVE